MTNQELHNTVFQRVHRLGRPRWGAAPNGEAWRPRPMIAGFRDYKCRQDIFGKSKRLKGTPYAIHEDYQAEIRSARGKLWGDFCKARSENRKARIVYPAKLIVDGTVVKDMFPAWNRWTLSEYQNPPPIDPDAPKFPRSGTPMEVCLAAFLRVPPFVPRAPPPARPQAGSARPPGLPPARPPGFPLYFVHQTQHEAESLASPSLRASYQAGLSNDGNGSVETETFFPTYPRSHLNFDSEQLQHDPEDQGHPMPQDMSLPAQHSAPSGGSGITLPMTSASTHDDAATSHAAVTSEQQRGAGTADTMTTRQQHLSEQLPRHNLENEGATYSPLPQVISEAMRTTIPPLE